MNSSQRALVAAKVVFDRARGDNSSLLSKSKPPRLSTPQVAAMLSVGITTVQDAKSVIRHAETEQIQAIMLGKTSVDAVARNLFQRTTTRQPRPLAPQSQTLRRNGKIWADLRIALDNIAGLPLPADAGKIAAGQSARIKYPLTARIKTALKWLHEFQENLDE